MVYVTTGAFVAFFLWAAYRVLYLHLRGLRTTGIITDIVEDVEDKESDGPVFHLVVQFTTSAGETIEARSGFGAAGVETYYRIGERVSVMYSAKNPRLFAIEGYDVTGAFILFLLAAGACAIFYWGCIRNGG